MEVSDWLEPPEPSTAACSRQSLLPPAITGLMGTLILHLAVVGSLYLEFDRNSRFVEDHIEGHAADAADTLADASITVELIGAQEGGQENFGQYWVPSLRKDGIAVPLDVRMPILRLPQVLNDAGDPGGSLVEDAQLTSLSGMYTGQIEARIERLWRRPRTRVNADANASVNDPVLADESFQCEAKIIQDPLGNVLEVLFPRCNGSPKWQQSLLTAIRQASPFPAPPSNKVLKASIALSFVALPFSKESAEDEYELDRIATRAQ